MSERAMRFRIGLFVLLALVMLGSLIILFGAIPTLFKGGRTFVIRFADAPGVTPGTPVRRSGVRVGEVRTVRLDQDTGEVRVAILIEPPYRPRRNDIPTLIVGLLGGDASIDFLPRPQPEGQPPLDRSPLPPDEEMEGERAVTVSSLLTKASDVVPTTQETLDAIRKSIQRVEKMVPLVEDTLKEYREVGRVAREMAPELRKTNLEVQEVVKSVREAVPDARKTLESIRDAVPEARETLKTIREAIPDARKALDDVAAASRSFTRLSERANVMLETNQEKINKGIDNAVKLIDNGNDVAQRAANLLSDENQRAVNATLKNTSRASERFGDLVLQAETAIKEGTETMKEAREAVKDSRRIMQRGETWLDRIEEILTNLQKATKPLAERADSILRNLDETSRSVGDTMGDVRQLFKVFDRSEGTLGKLVNDPSLYNNIDAIACQIARSLPRIDRILKDFETFADKLARHPESIGVGGVVRPGSGLKDPPTPPGMIRP
jgi:phospholipid/cholesterol/gamma-HCH transport system substrate-binding protein